MTLLPKPFKRAEKRCKPISRRARVNRKRKTSRGAQGRLADKLFSLIVRARGKCARHWPLSQPCQGILQCAHIVGRSYRSVRWSEGNALALCAGAHKYYTHHPVEFEVFVIIEIGEESLWELKRRALERWDGDLESVLVRLAARAVALGIKLEAARGEG